MTPPAPAPQVRGTETALDRVSVAFGAIRALDGLSLVVPAGTVTALLGPNGAGKSTTVGVIAGLVRPRSGRVTVAGHPPGSPAARHRVGVMLQEGGLPTGARGPELVRHIAGLRGAPDSAGPLIDRLGVASLGRTTVRRMSGGQRRRVSLACALVGDPTLVLLDEPSSGLDPEGRAIVWDIVEDLRSRGVAVLLSTHDLAEAAALADRIAIVAAGRVVVEGTPAALTAGADEAITFAAAVHLPLEGLATALPPGYDATEPMPGQYVVRGPAGSRIEPQALATVTAWCAQHGVLPRDLGVGGRTLADVYAQATRGDGA